MFVTIRRYSPKNGSVNRASLELLRRQIQTEFLPVIQEIVGFAALYVVSVDDRELMTMALYHSLEGTEQYVQRADEYTLKNPLMFELGRPEITCGQVLTAAAPTLALWPDHPGGMLLSAS